MRTLLPLELSFARTIHKFQGLQAGPVDKGKPPNAFETIVCDPDGKKAEGKATGLLYTAVSRATSLGDDNGLNSGIYFIGNDITPERVQRVSYKTNSSMLLANVERRSSWVNHLEANVLLQNDDDLFPMQKLFHWANSTPIPYDFLYTRTQQYIIDSPKQNQFKY